MRKNGKRQSGSDCLGPQAFVTYEEQKKKKTIIVAKGRERAGKESAVYNPLRESLVVGTIGVNGTQG